MEKKNNQKTLTVILAIALAVCAILAIFFGVKSGKVSGLLKEADEQTAALTKTVADKESELSALAAEKEEAAAEAQKQLEDAVAAA